jgi:hypothetical protein
MHPFAGKGKGAEGKGIGGRDPAGSARDGVNLCGSARRLHWTAGALHQRERGQFCVCPFTFLTNPRDFFTIIPFTDFLHSSHENFYFVTR